MAIQSSVSVLASLLFVAHAFTGLRNRGGSQVVTGQTPAEVRAAQAAAAFAAPDELGCPSSRFPTTARCRILQGPCLKQLQACDKFYEASPKPTWTSTIRRRTNPAVPHPVVPSGQKCEMATCLAQAGPGTNMQDADRLIVGPGYTTRTTNSNYQPTGAATQSDDTAIDPIATLCTKDFMKSRNSKFDKDLMRCVQLRARPVEKRPYHETITTTPAPGPANWFCVPSINYDRRSGGDIKKKVAGPFRDSPVGVSPPVLGMDLAKKELDSTWGARLLHQIVCEMRVPKYTNTNAAQNLVISLGNVSRAVDGNNDLLLGPMAHDIDLDDVYVVVPAATATDQTIHPQTVPGQPTTPIAQTVANSFNIKHDPQLAGVAGVAGFGASKKEMLDMCQNDKKCNPSAWR